MSASTSLPDFNSYESLGLNHWLDSNVSSFGYLLIEHADTLKNGRFKITTVGITNNAFNSASGFTVYSSELTTPDATKATDGQLKTGDKIYYYNHNNQTHTLVATVDTTHDGYYDDLKINFESGVSNATVLALGEALQYGAGSLGARSLTVSLYDTNNVKLDNTVVPASANPIILNSATDGFSFEDIRLSFTENANAIFAAAGSDTSIAYSAKDTLEGTFLEISAMSDFTAYMTALSLGSVEQYSPEFFNALNKMFGVIGDASGQKLDIDATNKSFTYDAQTHTLKVGDVSFATVSFGGELGNSNNPIKIEFTSNLATKALVNEVLQSITYQNTQDALFSLSVISWNLKQQTGVDTNNEPIISTLTSGQSLIALNSINDAPLLRPNSKIISYSERLDFDGQTEAQPAIQEGVYLSDNTSVLSNDLLSKGAGVLVATNGASTFTFNSPQTSVSLDFFNGVKAVANLSADDLAALGDSTEMLMMAGLPYHKVSFFNASNELLGVSEVTDLDIPSLSLFLQLMIFSQSRNNTSLLGLLPELDKLYNARFTAPQGQTIASVKIESVATTLTNVMQQSGAIPVLLDSITLGEVTTQSLNFPPLTAGQVNEFVVSDMIPTGTIVDPDIFPWDKNITPKAIAVSAVDNLQGEWKYKIGNGGAWTAFDFTNNTGKALLLSETDSLQFTPSHDFDGVLNNAITFYAWDKTTGNAGEYLTISGNTGSDKTLSIDSISASAMTPQAPTLTEIASIPAQNTGTQEITFAQLLAASNATDIDGYVVAFVVKSVSGGTLKIGVDANTATDFDNETVVSIGTNDTITAVKKIFWTPTESNAVFSVVAKDNEGKESAPPVQVRVERVNHEPVITSTPITTTNEDSVYSYSLTATDADSDQLTWSVTENETLPAWLSLSNGSSETSDFVSVLRPNAVASDPDGNTYVFSEYDRIIHKFASDGSTLISSWRIDAPSFGMIFESGNLYVSTYRGNILKYDSDGTQSIFAITGDRPAGMTVKDGFLYVANYGASKIQKIDLSNGTVSDYKTVASPFGVVFDSNDVMYVAKRDEKQIVKFSTIATDEAETLVIETDFLPYDIKIDASNNLYVSTSGFNEGGLFKYENLGTGTKTHITSPNSIFGMSLRFC